MRSMTSTGRSFQPVFWASGDMVDNEDGEAVRAKRSFVLINNDARGFPKISRHFCHMPHAV
jgi:hypothetical protein